MATSEEIKALTRRLYEEVLNGGDLALADELLTTDFVDRTPPLSAGANREGFRQAVGMFRAAFPDARWEIWDILAEGDKGVVRDVLRGTHRGELMGIPPTGKRVEISSIHIERFGGGQAGGALGGLGRARHDAVARRHPRARPGRMIGLSPRRGTRSPRIHAHRLPL
jgi:predicted ester cyclase